ncbi:MAG: hypothetical protein ACK4N4_15580 [Burkholderiales bacterium]
MKNITFEPAPDSDNTRIVERPDGFYWQNLETEEIHGPFRTLTEAVEDMEYNADVPSDAAGLLREAEDEIGIADWIDPETGEPAEEQVPHIEDR